MDQSNQTAVEWFWDKIALKLSVEQINEFLPEFENAKAIEEQQIKEAMMYALDEDGHTGGWKYRFVNDYYNKKFNNPTSRFDQDESRYPIH
jgi:hypothetical protein